VWKKLALNCSKRGRRVYTCLTQVAKMEILGELFFLQKGVSLHSLRNGYSKRFIIQLS
jgi:hypothetical protein